MCLDAGKGNGGWGLRLATELNKSAEVGWSTKQHLPFYNSALCGYSKTTIDVPCMFLIDNKTQDKSTNGINHTQMFNPLVCKPGTSIAQTLWQAHVNTLIPSQWMSILAADGWEGIRKVLSNWHVLHICVFYLCLGFVWRLSDKWRSQEDRIHLSDRWCHCCRLQGLRAWCIHTVGVCVCESNRQKVCV